MSAPMDELVALSNEMRDVANRFIARNPNSPLTAAIIVAVTVNLAWVIARQAGVSVDDFAKECRQSAELTGDD